MVYFPFNWPHVPGMNKKNILYEICPSIKLRVLFCCLVEEIEKGKKKKKKNIVFILDQESLKSCCFYIYKISIGFFSMRYKWTDIKVFSLVHFSFLQICTAKRRRIELIGIQK